MAILSADERSEGRQTGIALGNVFTFTSVFVVISDTKDEPQVNVLNASGVPTLGDVHPSHATAFVTGKEVELTASRLVYLVNVNYETPADGSESGGDIVAEDPTDEDPRIVWGFISEKEVIEFDNENEAIANSSAELFDPPFTRDKHRLQITITRNEKDVFFDPNVSLSFLDTINESEISISGQNVKAKTARIMEISAQSRLFNNIIYWEVNYRIAFDPDEWILKVLDQGFEEKAALDVPGDFPRNRPILSGKKPITKPVLLDGNGAVLKVGETPVVLDFSIRKQTDFGILGLPT